MTNEFILVRHATCEHMDDTLLGRTVDSPLDSRGMREAEAMARSFDPQDELLIVASPRRRAQQTAAAIAARTSAEIVTSYDVDELDFGHWSGRTFLQLADDPSWRRWNEHRGLASTPSGESIANVQARVLRHLHSLQDAFPGRPIVIVTHAEVIRSVILHWLEAPIDGYGRLVISPASLTRVSVGDWGVRIDGINQRAQS
jgi:broad specificity phosphatase PhoE